MTQREVLFRPIWLHFCVVGDAQNKHIKKTKTKKNFCCSAFVVMSGGARTRAQKRRIGERDSLWDLIVNNDDICFKHILPRLNSNDVKFLYGVNTETRKLIKRSSRMGDLKERFRVYEMASISTLEVAWENRENKSLWPSWWDETHFCREVAKTNKLELLKWAREEKRCKWDQDTIKTAAGQGNLEMVKYCVANECPIDNDACAFAALLGHLEVLKYLHKEAKAPWDSWTAEWAAKNGHLHILEYLVERKYDHFVERACENAAMNGHLDCLKYLRETAVGLSGRTLRAREQPNRMCTIPPRQTLSSPNRLAIRRWRVTQLVNTGTHTQIL